MQKPKVELEFDREMENVYKRAKLEAGYTASVFHQMLIRNGGLATAKQLINEVRESQGYSELYLRGRLDLTVEAVLVDNPKWHPLFSPDELEKARKRLVKYGYSGPQH